MNPLEVKTGQKKVWYWKAGITGSLIGGLVFGVMMVMMGMLVMVAGLVQSESSWVGFLVHMMISFIFGIAFAIFAGVTKWRGWASGIVYGIVLWFLFPFILMPMLMGMPEMAFQLTSASMMSLIGHVIYGLVTGLIYQWMSQLSS
jgi:uncharacterized membrane protein YagU involved in acid resistance